MRPTGLVLVAMCWCAIAVAGCGVDPVSSTAESLAPFGHPGRHARMDGIAFDPRQHRHAT